MYLLAFLVLSEHHPLWIWRLIGFVLTYYLETITVSKNLFSKQHLWNVFFLQVITQIWLIWNSSISNKRSFFVIWHVRTSHLLNLKGLPILFISPKYITYFLFYVIAIIVLLNCRNNWIDTMIFLDLNSYSFLWL